ncbi:MAG: hypothetical protein V3581_00330 [Candidatus Cardinium sp.]|uniref:hypothetical protein n=1 Tax=Candidatus Cardinium sp. TP TaxID=2961955 RepID=UPI0021B033B9|nr:hypothetical protein [Candidatus Cardinium sp. TP]MCT4697294.1 hypothetical protein [Candidatus Cardinium sp. TP]
MAQNTINQKYIHYKASLFIALLGLNTLSSCVHTRQIFGSRVTEGRQSRCDTYRYHVVINATSVYNHHHGSYNKNYIHIAWCILLMLLIGLGYFRFTFEEPLKFNATKVNRSTALFPLGTNIFSSVMPSTFHADGWNATNKK